MAKLNKLSLVESKMSLESQMHFLFTFLKYLTSQMFLYVIPQTAFLLPLQDFGSKTTIHEGNEHHKCLLSELNKSKTKRHLLMFVEEIICRIEKVFFSGE